ncbi:glycosyltransferase, partial [Sphaerisporangium rufum]|uniref:glycosyltransferase n=1 Tax=Sphaerisporangium rufum TaxID=1381558 RepID=UPI00194DEFB9
MKVAMISEHADPLATVGGVDAGGQNVHVAGLAAALAALGHQVTVYTRRTAPGGPASTFPAPGVTVERVPAGPAEQVPKDALLDHMPAFAEYLARRWAADRPDVAHAHFWMSGQAALTAAAGPGVPVVQTFHALGTVKRRWQGTADTSPPSRLAVERDIGRRADAIIATCTDEVTELAAMGVPAGRVTVVPCGVDLALFHPDGQAAPRAGRGDEALILSVGRLVPRKGLDTAVQALRHVPGARLIVAGGDPDDGEAVRLRALAAAAGLRDRVDFVGSVARALVP